jgi:AraC-like DNA-binding protein
MHEHSFLNLPFLFAFGFPHTVFVIIFLITKEERKLHDILASIWIFLLTFPVAQRFFFNSIDPSFPGIFFKSIIYSLSYGPMAYLYTKSLTQEKPRLKKRDLFHFVPILLVAIILSFLPENLRPHLSPPPPQQHPSPPPPGTPDFLVTAFIIDTVNLISVFTYSFLILKLLKKHAYSVENYFSTITNNRNLEWLKWTIWLFIFLFTWNSFSPILFKFVHHNLGIHWLYPHEFRFFHAGIFILFSYILSFFTIRQSIVYKEITNSLEKKQEIDESVKEEKYIRSGLKEEDAQKIAEKLLDYMEKEKPYLKEDLRIRDVADAIGVNLNYLSQSLNEVIKKNFYQFVNEYRVREVQNRLKDPRYEKYPVLRIALDCGFNSKSSFNSIFRRFTDISPKEFRKSISSH